MPKTPQEVYTKDTKVLDIHGQVWNITGFHPRSTKYLMIESIDPDPIFKNNIRSILDIQRAALHTPELEAKLKKAFKATRKAHKLIATLKDESYDALHNAQEEDLK